MEFLLSADEKRVLLFDARESISAELEKRRPVYSASDKITRNLKEPCGAFVSLHTGNRQLRGCIGRMTAGEPLIETVRMMAKEAAFGDPRFPPVKKEELSRCHIEISALSPMTPCSDPLQVTVGVHGLYLKKGMRSGVLLPQVPVEQGWDLKQYLDYICVKAGLPPRSYEDKDAQLLTFTAIVFAEE